MMQTDVPGARASHREAAQHQPARIDRVVVTLSHPRQPGPKRRQRFEQVGLPRPAIGVVAPPEQFELNSRQVFRGASAVGGDELRLGQCRIAAMQHEVQPVGVPPLIGAGQQHGVRLERSIDLGAVGAYGPFAGGLGPGGGSPFGQTGTGQTFVESGESPAAGVAVLPLVEPGTALGRHQANLDLGQHGVGNLPVTQPGHRVAQGGGLDGDLVPQFGGGGLHRGRGEVAPRGGRGGSGLPPRGSLWPETEGPHESKSDQPQVSHSPVSFALVGNVLQPVIRLEGKAGCK